jgi:hypothetical protein
MLRSGSAEWALPRKSEPRLPKTRLLLGSLQSTPSATPCFGSFSKAQSMRREETTSMQEASRATFLRAGKRPEKASLIISQPLWTSTRPSFHLFSQRSVFFISQYIRPSAPRSRASLLEHLRSLQCSAVTGVETRCSLQNLWGGVRGRQLRIAREVSAALVAPEMPSEGIRYASFASDDELNTDTEDSKVDDE